MRLDNLTRKLFRRPRRVEGVFVGRQRFRDMSYTYSKLCSSITESSVWCEPTATRITWIALLAMKDMHGRVFASVPGMANRARVTVEEAQKALDCFLAPDPHSRTKDFEGRRIREIDGGWELINHNKYRDMVDEVHQKAMAAERQRRHRAKKEREENSNAEGVTRNAKSVTECDSNDLSRHTDTDADTEKYKSDEPISPEMVASGVLVGLQLSGKDLRIVLEDICRMSMKAGFSADELRDSLVDAYREFDAAKPKLSYIWGAKTFFGEGHWRNKSGWPWNKGEQPKSRRYAEEAL
jgi:hypothetical protein